MRVLGSDVIADMFAASFSVLCSILDILEDFMVMRGYKYCRIDGNTDYETREASIEDFNREGSEKFCFILSTRAGKCSSASAPLVFAEGCY